MFWVRDEETIWLRSAAKAAHALGVECLTGRPVALPVETLLNGIGNFRAHMYAAFHSGRTKETRRGSEAMSISRATLAELSGVGESSQRAYEAQVDVEIQENFAVGERATKENHENCAWTQGQAVFELKDYRGQQGKKGQTYLAWQLPNSRALWEYDNIMRSLYLLDYIDSPALRRNVQRALSRGENYHQLRRAVSHANFGKLRFKTEHEQQIWSECSRLITNGILLQRDHSL